MPRTLQQSADRWGVPLPTWKRYIADGAPLGNDKKFYSYIVNLQRVPPWAKTSQRMKDMGYQPKAKAKARRAKAAIKVKTAEDFRNHYRDKLNEAVEANDTEGVKFWNEHYLKIDESIRKTELHAKKLGLEDGTTLSRTEVERIMRAVFYAGNANVQGVLTSLCEQLVGFDNPGDLYHALKPAIVGGRLFSGFDKVKNTVGAPSLPDWLVECVKIEAKQYLGNSEALWDKPAKKK